MDSDTKRPDALAGAPEEDTQGGFFSNILTPGSSLNPTFLLIVDVALGLLLLVLFSLFILTQGNLHLLFLMIIECCLWASIKWFVHELQKVPAQEQTKGADADSQPKSKRKDE